MSQCMSWPGPMRCCSSRSLPLSNAVTMSPATCRRHQDRQLACILENPPARSKNNPLLTLPHPHGNQQSLAAIQKSSRPGTPHTSQVLLSVHHMKRPYEA